MIDNLNQIINLLSICLSSALVISIILLLISKEMSKSEFAALIFIICIATLGLLSDFSSKRYYSILFIPSLLIISRALSIKGQQSLRVVFAFVLFMATGFLFLKKDLEHLRPHTHKYYLESASFFLRNYDCNILLTNQEDETNRFEYYLNKSVIVSPQESSGQETAEVQSTLASNKPFYYISKIKGQNRFIIKNQLLRIKMVLSFLLKKKGKSRITIFQIENVPQSEKQSIQIVNIENFLGELKEKGTANIYLLSLNNDGYHNNATIANKTINKNTRSYLWIDSSNRLFHFHYSRAFETNQSYLQKIVLYSFSSGILCTYIYYYDDNNIYLGRSLVNCYILQRSKEPITIENEINMSLYPQNAKMIRPYFTVFGKVAIDSMCIYLQ